VTVEPSDVVDSSVLSADEVDSVSLTVVSDSDVLTTATVVVVVSVELSLDELSSTTVEISPPASIVA